MLVPTVLFLGCTVLWVRSYFIYDGWRWNYYSSLGPFSNNERVAVNRPNGHVLVSIERGAMIVSSEPHSMAIDWDDRPLYLPRDQAPLLHYERHEHPAFPTNSHWVRWFAWRHLGQWGQPLWHDFLLVIPLWVPALLFSVAPSIWVIRLGHLRTRFRRGLCLVCGYDLRASRERCPECGEPIPTTRSVDVTSARESERTSCEPPVESRRGRRD
jgi:hypothetical protein